VIATIMVSLIVFYIGIGIVTAIIIDVWDGTTPVIEDDDFHIFCVLLWPLVVALGVMLLINKIIRTIVKAPQSRLRAKVKRARELWELLNG
jgi:uncharacterized paraquat-inducible protein A